jgi:hypothetical protein
MAEEDLRSPVRTSKYADNFERPLHDSVSVGEEPLVCSSSTSSVELGSVPLATEQSRPSGSLFTIWGKEPQNRVHGSASDNLYGQAHPYTNWAMSGLLCTLGTIILWIYSRRAATGGTKRMRSTAYSRRRIEEIESLSAPRSRLEAMTELCGIVDMDSIAVKGGNLKEFEIFSNNTQDRVVQEDNAASALIASSEVMLARLSTLQRKLNADFESELSNMALRLVDDDTMDSREFACWPFEKLAYIKCVLEQLEICVRRAHAESALFDIDKAFQQLEETLVAAQRLKSHSTPIIALPTSSTVYQAASTGYNKAARAQLLKALLLFEEFDSLRAIDSATMFRERVHADANAWIDEDYKQEAAMLSAQADASLSRITSDLMASYQVRLLSSILLVSDVLLSAATQPHGGAVTAGSFSDELALADAPSRGKQPRRLDWSGQRSVPDNASRGRGRCGSNAAFDTKSVPTAGPLSCAVHGRGVVQLQQYQPSNPRLIPSILVGHVLRECRA